jgi:hypothetical protein
MYSNPVKPENLLSVVRCTILFTDRVELPEVVPVGWTSGPSKLIRTFTGRASGLGASEERSYKACRRRRPIADGLGASHWLTVIGSAARYTSIGVMGFASPKALCGRSSLVAQWYTRMCDLPASVLVQCRLRQHSYPH